MHNKTKIFRKAQRTSEEGEEMVELGRKKDCAYTAEVRQSCRINRRQVIGAIIAASLAAYTIGVILTTHPFQFVDSNCTIAACVFANNKGLAFLFLVATAASFYTWDRFSGRVIIHPCLINLAGKKSLLWGVEVLLGVCVLVYLVLSSNPRNWISAGGLFSLIISCIAMSRQPRKINWRIVIIGLETQFVLGIFLMRTEFGYQLFKFMSEQVAIFLEYTNNGSILVFGDALVTGGMFGEKFFAPVFAFRVVPVVIFFSAMVSLLHYFGAIQYMILKIAWLVSSIMGTSPTESVNAAANIFLGITEAPFLIKPFLEKMTDSEIFAVMTSGFATVAGSVLAAYISFNIPANHLVVASLMAAPTSLIISKIIYPEKEKTEAGWDAITNIPKSEHKNMFEAISGGASAAIAPITGIVSNLIAFTAVFAFLDSVCKWATSLLGFVNLGVTGIFQYLLYPLVYIIGVDAIDVLSVSKLVGLKMFVNEFVAFSELGKSLAFRKEILDNGLYDLYKNGSLPLPETISMVWEDKSITIATYALCGFANFAAMGIAIGGLSALAPGKLKVFSKLVFRAMIAGNITNFCTACIAGILFEKI